MGVSPARILTLAVSTLARRALAALACLALAAGCSSTKAGRAHTDGIASAPTARAGRGEVVVLIHGLLNGPGSMRRLNGALEDAGYRVLNWSYQSSQGKLEPHAVALRDTLDLLAGDPQVERIHLVGFSLGGLVARAALAGPAIDRRGNRVAAATTAKLSRLVTLATPHAGSPRARWLRWFLAARVPIIGELDDSAGSPVHALGLPRGVEVGTIAGARDRTVSVASSRLATEQDHLVVDSGHRFIMSDPQTVSAVLSFLATGSFGVPSLVPGKTPPLAAR